jgi:hypothetical protein
MHFQQVMTIHKAKKEEWVLKIYDFFLILKKIIKKKEGIKPSFFFIIFSLIYLVTPITLSITPYSLASCAVNQ